MNVLDIFAKSTANGQLDNIANSLLGFMPILCGDDTTKGYKCLNEQILHRLLLQRDIATKDNAKRCAAVVLLHCLEHRGYAKYLDIDKDFKQAFSRGHYITRKAVKDMLAAHIHRDQIYAAFNDMIDAGAVLPQDVAKKLYPNYNYNQVGFDKAKKNYLSQKSVRHNGNFKTEPLLEILFVVPHKFVEYCLKLEYSQKKLTELSAHVGRYYGFIQLLSLNPMWNRLNREYMNTLPPVPTLAQDYPRPWYSTTENKQYPATVPSVPKPFEFPHIPRKTEEEVIDDALQIGASFLLGLDGMCEKK